RVHGLDRVAVAEGDRDVGLGRALGAGVDRVAGGVAVLEREGAASGDGRFDADDGPVVGAPPLLDPRPVWHPRLDAGAPARPLDELRAVEGGRVRIVRVGFGAIDVPVALLRESQLDDRLDIDHCRLPPPRVAGMYCCTEWRGAG